jgi:hypothetical protein
MQRQKRWQHRGLKPYLEELFGWTYRDEEAAPPPTAATTLATYIPGAPTAMEIGMRFDEQLKALSERKPLREKQHILVYWQIQYLYQRRWLCCGVQVPLWSADNSAGSVMTYVDMICYDLVNKQFVLLELKTQHVKDYEKTFTNQRKLHAVFENSHYWHHQCQLGWMYNIIRQRLRVDGKPLAAYVIRVSARHRVCQPHALRQEIVDYFTIEHERQANARYLIDNGNSNDAGNTMS